MSARRLARSRDPERVLTEHGVPRCLAVGALIEVWAETLPEGHPRQVKAHLSARRRHGVTRSWWLDVAEMNDRHGWSLIPGGAPWSSEFMTTNGHRDQVLDRLEHAAATPDDLPTMRVEATALHRRALAAKEDE